MIAAEQRVHSERTDQEKDERRYDEQQANENSFHYLHGWHLSCLEP
jgi:hypothetical protein